MQCILLLGVAGERKGLNNLASGRRSSNGEIEDFAASCLQDGPEKVILSPVYKLFREFLL